MISLSTSTSAKYTEGLIDYLNSSSTEGNAQIEVLVVCDSDDTLVSITNNDVVERIYVLHRFRTTPIIHIRCNINDLEKLANIDGVCYIDYNFRCYLSIDSQSSLGTHEWKLKSVIPWKKKRESTGKGICIAILDSGIDKEQNGIQKQVRAKIDLTNESWDDLVGHGTMMVGLISNIAPASEFIDVKICDRSGLFFASDVLRGLDELYPKQVDIIVLGFASPIPSTETNAICHMLQKFADRGVFTVGPSGNFGPESNTVGFTSHIPNGFCIGSMKDETIISFFTSRNDTKPDFFTLGENITTISSFHGFLGTPHPVHANKRIISGTSIAAAKFAGILSLIKQTFRNYSYSDLYRLIAMLTTNTKMIPTEKIKEKVSKFQPQSVSFRSSVFVASIITGLVGILGILSIILVKYI